MERYERLRRPDYTDLAVVLGPSVKWVQEDYRDLQHAHPEVLLGYRVRLADPHTRLWGYEVKKLVIVGALEMVGKDDAFNRAVEEAVTQTLYVSGGEVERWYVHRGKGIYRW